MNIRQLFRKLKAKLKGISNYKEVLDQSGNVLMYSGSVKAPQPVQFIWTYRGLGSGEMIKEIVQSLKDDHLVTSYKQFGSDKAGSISIITIKNNQKIVKEKLQKHLSPWIK